MWHKKRRYASDMSNEAWQVLAPMLLVPLNSTSKRGRPMQLSLREVLNAIFYVVRTGC
ncbi:MAG: transposase [Anaerolineae bacterium]|nr:transposase [Anaerolineae bacterium]